MSTVDRPEPLPPIPLRGQVHNGLREVERRWRRIFPRRPPEWAGSTASGSGRPVWPESISVSLASANPIGRGPGGNDLPTGELSLTTDAGGDVWWRVHIRDRLVVAGRAGDALAEPHRVALRRLGSVVHADEAAGCVAHPQASVIAHLAATGVVLHAPDLRAATRALLGAELREIVAGPSAAKGADPLEWELRGIAQRRAAMRGHGIRPTQTPTVSAVLVTRRPAYVARAVADLFAQAYPAFEIVIGLHGVTLESDLRARLDRGPVPVAVVHVPATMSFGEAVAAATRAATGDLVAKVDDDDRYGPEHLWDLVLARAYSGAAVVGKPAEFVHLTRYDATVRRRTQTELYCDSVAGGTMLIGRRDLDDVGGWPPLAHSVDRGLLDQVLGAGGQIYRTHGFGYVYSRHADGHTWDPGPRYFVLNPVRHWAGHPLYPEFGTDDAL